MAAALIVLSGPVSLAVYLTGLVVALIGFGFMGEIHHAG